MHPAFREELMKAERLELERRVATAWWHETSSEPRRPRLRLPRLRIVLPAWRRHACTIHGPGR